MILVLKMRLVASVLWVVGLMFSVKGVTPDEMTGVEEESILGHVGIVSVSTMVRPLASAVVHEGKIVLCTRRTMELVLVVRSRAELT